jgi:uncharacterized membrane protein
MLKKDPAALVTIGINIISAALCVPTQFPITATFYRAVILYVINIFVTEIPKWGKISHRKKYVEYIQIILFFLGFILIAIGVVNVATPYSTENLPQQVTNWNWCYFVFSLLMLFLSIISNLEGANIDSSGTNTPPVLSVDPSSSKG